MHGICHNFTFAMVVVFCNKSWAKKRLVVIWLTATQNSLKQGKIWGVLRILSLMWVIVLFSTSLQIEKLNRLNCC